MPGQTPISFNLPTEPGATAGGALKPLGPFVVLAVGNRLGTIEAMNSDRVSQKQDDVLAIKAVYDKKTKTLDPRISKLLAYLRKTSYKPLDVVIPGTEKVRD